MSKYIDASYLFNKSQAEKLLKQNANFNIFYLFENNKYLKTKDFNKSNEYVVSDADVDWFVYPMVGNCNFFIKNKGVIEKKYIPKAKKINNIYSENKRQLLFINGEYHWRCNGVIGQNVYLEKRKFEFNEK